MSSKYSKPPARQDTALLLCLPLELRRRILISLLGENETIHSSRFLEVSEGYYSEHIEQRSAQVLGTCQQLYAEGCIVLYGCNTLGIRVASFNESVRRCSILKSQFLIRSYDNFHHSASADVFRYDRWGDTSLKEAIESSVSGSFIKNTTELLARLQGIYKFSNYILDLKIDRQEQLFVVCRLLRDMLARKNVTINVSLVLYHDLDPFPPDMLHNVFDTTRILKCKQLTVRCTRDELHRPGRPATKVFTRQIIHNDLIDNFEDYEDLLRDVVRRLPCLGSNRQRSESFFNSHTDELKLLHGHMLSYRHAEYQHQRKVILGLAVEWNKRWLHHREQVMSLWLDAAKAHVQSTNEILAEAAEGVPREVEIECAPDFALCASDSEEDD